MLRRLFWIFTGAGLGLWGRQRALDTVNKRIPKPLQRLIKRDVVDRVRRFNDEVRDLERKRVLERELEELRRKEAARKP